jgi:predicted dehydrogenase
MITSTLHEPALPSLLERPTRPRLGFLGAGWIGRHRLQAIANSGLADVAAIADPLALPREQLAAMFPNCARLDSLDGLLEMGLDGIVIASPSALHAEQAVAALDSGIAVFCQKPLGRNAVETRRVIDAARQNNVLLGADMSYRFLTHCQRIRDLIQNGELGHIYAADLVFHNAYGPDKPWFYDRRLSGGGCVIDLGIHLVDLALWMLGFPKITHVTSRLHAKGKPLSDPTTVEDYAVARIDVATGATLQLACSWNLPAGCEAVISASFFGTEGGATLRNVESSFYNFIAEQFHGTKHELLTDARENWGAQAALDWTRRLATGSRFSPAITELATVAEALDAIYRSHEQ